MTNVGNLAFHSTQDSLRDAFTACGQVVDVHLVAEDRANGRRDSGNRGHGPSF